MTPNAPDFAKLVPGFDFLQGLVKNAGSVLPGIGQWVAPTLNPEEIERRIEELRTVQFWLEQNARMLGATIQALEVQRMTLSTLKTMNVQMTDLREAMRIKTPGDAAAAELPAAASPGATPMAWFASAPAAAAAGSAEPAKPGAAPAPSARRRSKPKASTGAAVVDPMQWWGALTKQFSQLAAAAMKDAATDTAKQVASDVIKQGFNVADQTIKAGMAPAQKAAKVAGGVANQVARSVARAKAAVPPVAAAAKPVARAGKSAGAAKRRVTAKR